MSVRAGNPAIRLLLISVLIAVSWSAVYLPNIVSAQTVSSVVRSSESATVSPGETVNITVTPSGITGFFAVKEMLGGMELVEHDADNLVDGTFIMLQPRILTYTVKAPVGSQDGDQFEISGQWWTDPTNKNVIAPNVTIITVERSTPTVTRTSSHEQAVAGDVVTISVSLDKVSGFYAVKENLGGLELLGHTADNVADGTFIMLQAEPFQYEVRIPNTAQPDQQFVISGLWWNDPSDKRPVLPATTEITVISATTTPGEVHRSPGSKIVGPGESVTIEISPHEVDGFFAVKEAFGSLELVGHTADNFADGTFIMLQAKPFTYQVRMPTNATSGIEFIISGQWWTDPTDKHDVIPPVTRLTIEGKSTVLVATVTIPAQAVDFEIPVRILGVAEPGLGSFDLSVAYDPSVVNLTGVGANPEGFNLTVNAQQGHIRVLGFDLSPATGDFLLLTLHADAVGNGASSTSLSLTVNTLADADGIDIQFTTEDGHATLIAGAVLSVADIDVPESVGNAQVKIALDRALSNVVTVWVSTQDGTATSPADYNAVNRMVTIPAGQLHAILAIPIVNDALVEGDETFMVNLRNPAGARIDSESDSAIVTIRDDDTQAGGVTRSLDSGHAPPGGSVKVTLTPNNVGGVYAVRENFGGLVLESHTADDFVSGVFIVIEPRTFTYTLKVPLGAIAGTQYQISGQWWTDPGVRHLVLPAQSTITVIDDKAPHCGDQDGDGRVTVIDAIIDLQFLTGLADPTHEQERKGDANGDGNFNILDVVAILQAIVRLNTLPVQCES